MKAVWVTFTGAPGHYNLHEITDIQPVSHGNIAGTRIYLASGRSVHSTDDLATTKGVIDQGVTDANAP